MSTRTRASAGSPEFRDLCRRFRDLEARKAVDEASANFEQAHLIHDARVRLKLPVDAICDALDLSPQSVNTYRNVAERIDERLFQELIEARRADGLALFPWSIIAQVARLAGREEREELIRRIRRHGWRTRDVQGYVSVERSDAAARIEDPSGRRRSRAHGTEVGGDRAHAQRDDASSAVGALATRMETVLEDASRTESPTRVLVAVAEVASRMFAEAARDVDRGRPPARELCEARDALTRCAAAASAAVNAIRKRLSEARVDHGQGSGAPKRETGARAQLEPIGSV